MQTKLKTKLTALGCAAALCVGLCGCSLPGAGLLDLVGGSESEPESSASAPASSPAGESSNPESSPLQADTSYLLQVFPDMEADLFKATGTPGETLQAQSGEVYGKIRFLTFQDNATVLVQKVMEAPCFGKAVPCETPIEVQAVPGRVYEFDGKITGSDSEFYRVTVSRGGERAALDLNSKGVQDRASVKLKNDPALTAPLTKDDNIVKLAQIYANTSFRAGGDIKDMPEFFWATLREGFISLCGKQGISADRYFIEDRTIEALAWAMYRKTPKDFPQNHSINGMTRVDGDDPGWGFKAVLSEVDKWSSVGDITMVDGDTAEVEIITTMSGEDKNKTAVVLKRDTGALGWHITEYKEQ